MLIFNLIISIIILLLIFFLIEQITKKLVSTFMEYEYKTYYILFPTLIIFGLWSLMFILWYITLAFILNIDITGELIKLIVKEGVIENSFISASFIFILIGIFLQSFAILLININYKKIFGNARFFFKRILKIRNKKGNKLIIKNDPEKIGFLTALFISFLLFIIFTFSITLLIFIGLLIGKKFV